MRVLFVKPENYKAVCNWYDRLKEVKNHPKTTVICQSPEEFRAQFDKDKFGVKYTTFYFDEEFGMIRNIKKYLLAVLFNAPSTINGYYTALVAHDMNTGSWGPPQNR